MSTSSSFSILACHSFYGASLTQANPSHPSAPLSSSISSTGFACPRPLNQQHQPSQQNQSSQQHQHQRNHPKQPQQQNQRQQPAQASLELVTAKMRFPETFINGFLARVDNKFDSPRSAETESACTCLIVSCCLFKMHVNNEKKKDKTTQDVMLNQWHGRIV